MNATDYAIRYPRYCRACSGIGGHKARADRMPEECPECYGKGLCGRCAAELPKYTAVCPTCDWRAFNAEDALPGATYV
jgi:DnaJ-class molecular chaperone